MSALSFSADNNGYSAEFTAENASHKIHVEFAQPNTLIKIYTKNDASEEYGIRAVVKNAEPVFDTVADFVEGELVKVWADVEPNKGSTL